MDENDAYEKYSRRKDSDDLVAQVSRCCHGVSTLKRDFVLFVIFENVMMGQELLSFVPNILRFALLQFHEVSTAALNGEEDGNQTSLENPKKAEREPTDSCLNTVSLMNYPKETRTHQQNSFCDG